jgi:peptidoglycan biosynthesis protein MviN/MurJ (putative lipid II flippase)
VAAQNHEEQHRTFRDTLELSLLFLSPIAVFCLMLDHNIIRLVFQRGMFTTGATELMAMIFFYYSLSLLPFAFLRLLSFCLFARREPGVYFRLSLFHYSVVLIFDLFYVGVLRMGPKGIPLGFLTGSLLACGMAIQRNLGDLDTTLDRLLGRFAAKDVAAALLAALGVWGLRTWMTLPVTTSQDFVYLCVICGVGSVVHFATLAALRALPVTQFTLLWPRGNSS